MNTFRTYRILIPALFAIAILPARAVTAPEADRAAILAMQGDYDVDFNFEETTLLAQDYERAPAYRSAGSELVMVLEDGTDTIVLQHILVDPKSGHVTKHWRQDWTWEADHRFEFTADRTWQVRPLPAHYSRGTWTQCVFEVDDAPRYCGTGRWRHEHGVSTWTSDDSWRPLPRREYTRRSDYNALLVVNRHTIVPGGWTHEQANTKVLRDSQGRILEVIARESGFNDYRNDTQTDFSPAHAYWKATSSYWQNIRHRWNGLLGIGAGLQLNTEIDGMALIKPLFELAAQAEQGKQVPERKIDKLFHQWVKPLETRSGDEESGSGNQPIS